jgi:hypothetical protein
VAVAGHFPQFGSRALATAPEKWRAGVQELPPPRHFVMIFSPLVYLAILLFLYWVGTRWGGGLPPI